MKKNEYRARCSNCEDKKTLIEQKKYVSYYVEDFLVSLINVPLFYCDSCGHITYRKNLGINEILLKCHENDYNVVIFD